MHQLITNLDQIRQLATERHDDFAIMKYLLLRLDDVDDDELDGIVQALTERVASAIDCTQCANCCRSLDVYLIPEDIETLAAVSERSYEQLLADVVDCDLDAETGEWGRFRHKPCRFLDGRLCSVYAHRPDSCRTYPALTPDFRWTLDDTIEGAALCPIIYNVLAIMVDLVDVL
jgi:uncharacterized protein